ncbi:MAG: helix-turn-helix domain-containing protein, partial [Tumebacillaceae bacterium]
YLIKPFDLERCKKSLDKYVQFKSRLSKSHANALDQMVVDDLKKLRSSSAVDKQAPKGIDQRTLERIQQCLAQSDEFLSAEAVAESVGLSRSTARTYLIYLVEQKVADEELLYGTVGRPQRLYRIWNA